MCVCGGGGMRGEGHIRMALFVTIFLTENRTNWPYSLHIYQHYLTAKEPSVFSSKVKATRSWSWINFVTSEQNRTNQKTPKRKILV